MLLGRGDVLLGHSTTVGSLIPGYASSSVLGSIYDRFGLVRLGSIGGYGNVTPPYSPNFYTHSTSDSLTFTDSYLKKGPSHVRIADAISFSETFNGRNAVRRSSILDTFTLSESLIVKNSVHHVSLNDTATFSSRFNTIWNRKISDTAHFSDTYSGVRNIIRIFTDSLTYNEIETAIHAVNKLLRDDLHANDLFPVNVVYGRTIVDSYSLNDDFRYVLLLGLTYPTPQPVGTPLIPPRPLTLSVGNVASRNTTFLEGKDTSITLPAAEFGDTESSANSVTVRRSMTAKTYAYKKTTAIRTLKYTWLLPTNKVKELVVFLQANLTNQFKMTNWKGEQWLVNCVTNPTTLTSMSPFKPEKELWSIELLFVGTKING